MPRVLLLNPLSLLGTEVRRALEARPDLWGDVRAASNDPELVGTLLDVAGAAAVVEAFSVEEVGGVDLLMVCDRPYPTGPELARLDPTTTVLFADGGSGVDEARVVVSGINDDAAVRGARLASPPAPVVLLAHLLAPLRDLGLERAVASVLLPASSRDQAGLDELLEQTRSILAFRGELPSAVFGSQLAFNALPVEAVQAPLLLPLREVLGGSVALSVSAVQAAIFHGVSVSLWLALSEPRSASELSEAITASGLVEPAPEPLSLGPVTAATSDRILLGSVEPDPGQPGAFWIWAVMDNLTRGGALNAVGVAEGLLAVRH
jgi:aspartate-semialdehyde dehydrogenase